MTESFNRKLGRLAQNVSGTGSITTNAATASTWQNARTITLGGDLSGNVSIDGSENVTLTATVSGDSIVLGTDTTGNYVATISAGSGITVTGSGTETAAVTVAIDNTVATLTGSQTLTNKTINVDPSTGNVFQIQGNGISSYVGSGANVVLSSSPTITNLYVPGTGMYFNGATSGITNVQATAVAGNTTITLPAANDTLVGKNTTDTLTNKTISGANNTLSNIGNSSLTNSSITVNGVSVALGASGTLYTDDVAEDGSPTNRYFTDARARAAISVTDSGGDGSLSYDNGTGVITYTGPSATEVRAHLSSGTGLTYTTGQFAIDSTVATLTGSQTLTNKTISGADNTLSNIGNTSLTNSSITINGSSVSLGGTRTLVTDDIAEDGSPVNLWYTDGRARAAISVTDAGGDGSLSYTSGTGVITYTGPSASEVRAHFSAGTGVAISSGQVSIGQAVATTDNVTFAGVTADNIRVGVTAANEIDTSSGNLTLDSASGTTTVDDNATITGNLQVDGNLTVSGTTVTINATNLAVEDNMIYLNNGSAVTNPDLGIAGNYNDGTYRHAGLFRDATDGVWKFFHQYTPEPDASAYIDTAHASFALANVQAASFTGSLTGNASTASALATARNISLTGDVTGSASFDGSTAVSITATIAADSVALGTDTTGNYVASITNGNYITGGNGGSEGAALTLAVDATSSNTASKVVARDSSGNFSAGTITATLSGNASTVTNGVYTTDTGTVTNTMLAGSIANNKLANSTISGVALGSNLGTLTMGVSGTGLSGSQTYNGSGAATFTVTSNATSANTASTIVARDASGNFTAGTITAALSGNATTATTAGSITSQANSATITAATAPTANTIALRDSNGDIAAREIVLSSALSTSTPTVLVSMFPSSNQLVRTTPGAVAAALSGQTMNISGNATTTSQRAFTSDISTTGQGRFTGWYSGNAATGVAAEIGYSGGEGYVITYNRDTSSYGTTNIQSGSARIKVGSAVNVDIGALQQGGNQVLHAGNYNSYSPTLTGTGASGTWGISISGNAATATSASSASNASAATYASTLYSSDLRTIAPNGHTAYRATFGFTSWANNSGAPYADYLHLRSYSDSSGGNDNLVMFLKSGIGMRIWQQSFNSGTAYSSYKDIAFTDGTNSSGTWSIRVTGFANAGSQRLYSTDAAYNYDAANPYYGYLTYIGANNRWRFQVLPATPAAVEVAYADVAGSATNGLTTSNYSSYALPLSGGTISGNIRMTGGGYGSDAISSSSPNGAGRVFAPQGAAGSWDGTQTGAIKIRLPFKANNPMWYMTVKIYNYNSRQISEYKMGNYSYSDGSYNSAATCHADSGAPIHNVRFGNDGSYDCVWIGETSTSWSYPVVAVTDFSAGFRSGEASNTSSNWNISIVTSFNTVGGTLYPASNTGYQYAYAYYGNSNVGGTGSASYHPSGIYSLGTNWLYGAMYLNRGNINEGGTIYMNNWFRSEGGTGWYNQTYGAGIWMSDSSWVRVYGTVGFYATDQIAAVGNITAYYSDERLKTKTGSISDALSKVMGLNGFFYVENDVAKAVGYKNDKQQVGVSAQEVQAILPEAVSLAPFDMHTEEDGTIVSKSGETYLTVDYSRLVPLLIEAIKEQQQEINELKKHIKNIQ